jgi:hypothetical protein
MLENSGRRLPKEEWGDAGGVSGEMAIAATNLL